VFVVFLAESIVPVTALVCLNIVAVYRFRQRLAARAALGATSNQAASASDRFTRYILLLTGVCLVTKSLELISAAFTRMNVFSVIEFSVEQSAMIHLSKEVTNCMLYAAHGFEAVVYFKMDMNLRKIFGFGYNKVVSLLALCKRLFLLWLRVNLFVLF